MKEEDNYLLYIGSFLLGMFIIVIMHLSYTLFPKDNKKSLEEKFTTVTQPNSVLYTGVNSINISNVSNTSNNASNVSNNVSSNVSNNTSSNVSNNTSSNTSNIQPIIAIPPSLQQSIIPQSSYNYIFLSTFNQSKIVNNELKWYDMNVDFKKVLSTDYNKGVYFSINNPIIFTENKDISSIKGANLKNTELSGPNALYFANDNIKSFYLNEFSTIFMLKFNSVPLNSTLFEILCNTDVEDNSSSDPKYIANAININLVYINNKFNISTTIGSSVYEITGIDKNIIMSNDILLIALRYDSRQIILSLNNKSYSFNINSSLKNITVGTKPVTINKNGELDITLYSFGYYKKFLTDDELTEYKKYNNYYLTGINSIEDERNKLQNIIANYQLSLSQNATLINNVSNQLTKCSYIIEDSSINDYQLQVVNPLKPILPSTF